MFTVSLASHGDAPGHFPSHKVKSHLHPFTGDAEWPQGRKLFLPCAPSQPPGQVERVSQQKRETRRRREQRLSAGSSPGSSYVCPSQPSPAPPCPTPKDQFSTHQVLRGRTEHWLPEWRGDETRQFTNVVVTVEKSTRAGQHTMLLHSWNLEKKNLYHIVFHTQSCHVTGPVKWCARWERRVNTGKGSRASLRGLVPSACSSPHPPPHTLGPSCMATLKGSLGRKVFKLGLWDKETFAVYPRHLFLFPFLYSQYNRPLNELGNLYK